MERGSRPSHVQRLFPTSKNSRFRPNSQRIFYISAYLFPIYIYIYTKRTESDAFEWKLSRTTMEKFLFRGSFNSSSIWVSFELFRRCGKNGRRGEGEIGTKRGEIRRAMERAIEVDKERRKGVVRRRVFLASGGEL